MNLDGFSGAGKRAVRFAADYFVSGVSGEQFALPEAIGLLRAIRKAPQTGELITLSAADPLNLQGILTPGGRIAALASESNFVPRWIANRCARSRHNPAFEWRRGNPGSGDREAPAHWEPRSATPAVLRLMNYRATQGCLWLNSRPIAPLNEDHH